jgi:hypothetical protein
LYLPQSLKIFIYQVHSCCHQNASNEGLWSYWSRWLSVSTVSSDISLTCSNCGPFPSSTHFTRTRTPISKCWIGNNKFCVQHNIVYWKPGRKSEKWNAICL